MAHQEVNSNQVKSQKPLGGPLRKSRSPFRTVTFTADVSDSQTRHRSLTRGPYSVKERQERQARWCAKIVGPIPPEVKEVETYRFDKLFEWWVADKQKTTERFEQAVKDNNVQTQRNCLRRAGFYHRRLLSCIDDDFRCPSLFLYEL